MTRIRTRTAKAFTLVELIMVIVIIGLLAAVVTPKFTSLKTEASNAAEQGGVSAIRSGVKLTHLTSLAQGNDTYPAALDAAAVAVSSDANPLFTNVLEDGITDGNWEKTGASTYIYNPTTNTYTYTPADGKFKKP